MPKPKKTPEAKKVAAKKTTAKKTTTHGDGSPPEAHARMSRGVPGPRPARMLGGFRSRVG
ncbi:hypothetical protein ACWGIN_31540 [Streptomyces sp. NPDC054861]